MDRCCLPEIYSPTMDGVDLKNHIIAAYYMKDTLEGSTGAWEKAEAAALLADHGVQDYLHLNDNYRGWDDDLIPAAVHVPEFLELVYWLIRTGCKGWLTLDIFSCREEKILAAVESFQGIRSLMEAVQERGAEAITEVVRRGEATDSVRMVREMPRPGFRNGAAGVR